MENTLSIPVALLAQGSIRIDGITYYRHGNKVRACKSRRSPKKTRTEGEEESSSRFTEARKMWRIYRRAIGDLPIWKLMAKEMGINKSDSLFHSQNSDDPDTLERVAREKGYGLSRHSDSRQARWTHR